MRYCCGRRSIYVVLEEYLLVFYLEVSVLEFRF